MLYKVEIIYCNNDHTWGTVEVEVEFMSDFDWIHTEQAIGKSFEEALLEEANAQCNWSIGLAYYGLYHYGECDGKVD